MRNFNDSKQVLRSSLELEQSLNFMQTSHDFVDSKNSKFKDVKKQTRPVTELGKEQVPWSLRKSANEYLNKHDKIDNSIHAFRLNNM